MSAERFDELYEKYADGTLSAAERGDFVRLLEDPVWRARLASISSYEAAITQEVKLAATEPEARPSSRSLPRVGSRRIPIQRPAEEPDEARILGRIGVAAAAAVLIILFIIFGSSPKPETPMAIKPKPAPVREVPTPEEPRVVLPEPPAPASSRAPVAEPRLTPRKFDPTPAPELTPPAPPPPAPTKTPAPEAPKPVRESVTFVAVLERFSGEVSIGTESGEAGKGIASGRTLTTGRTGYASLKFPDGTRIELGADTVLSRIADGAAGKSAQLEQGMMFVDAVKQPAGRPLTVATAQAESLVVGTQFVLSAAPTFTRIDVREGKVKFTRLPQAVTSVMVNTGHYAVAGAGGELVAKPGVGLWKAPPAALQMWLRADTGVKLNGSGVAAWIDASPAGNTATQEKPAAQPTLVANALPGKPALRFDGNDDSFVLPDGFSDFRAGLTAFVVVRPAPGGAWARFIDLDVGPACDNIVFGRKDAPDKLGFWVYSNSQTKGKVEAPGAIVSDQVQSFCALLNPGGRVTLYRNGAPVATGETSVPKNTVRKPNTLGKSNAGGGDPLFKGDFFELLLYNRALSEAERLYVESYLNAKYFDPTVPPVSLRPSDK